ncbi:DUF2252 domain-containing protein [Cyanobium sp. FACHB-13342]|uniref:DUF2252 domain-containing protein n=1 Tax=Cyanobium sp. FACHB-13342 TaxID=2692793 RepID=UPI0016807DDD|nr:DUF2252 domain-containing protein [Cyanobium sp. FACHB-13342]MBD2421916.1 DUF2252 domain-containing protein [Cyanobium sp. FACHB-13342]
MNSGPRLDPLELLRQQEANRLPWLLPERQRRMAESPFAFFRGAAIVMAADLGREPHSGLMVQLCGDAHLLNFGFYGSPERQLLFGINDFDETHPGPFEWDVLRLAASFVLAARSLGLSEKQQSRICRRTVRAYGEAMAEFAAMALMPMWVARLPLERLIDERASANFRTHLSQVTEVALHRDSRQAVRKLCEADGRGALRFRHQPPLIWRFDELEPTWLAGMDWQDWSLTMLRSYMGSISSAMQHLLGQYQFTDSALKAVGVGSIGTRCGITLFVGPHPDDILVLQGKQAEPSVLAPFVNLPAPKHQGQRVVEGQRLLQTASDAFLGWTTNPAGDHIYIRHFRDWKASVDVAQLDGDGLKDYGWLCGWTLAKAHARGGDRRAMAAHIDDPKHFAQGLLQQAVHHADLAEADHASFVGAMSQGHEPGAEMPSA